MSTASEFATPSTERTEGTFAVKAGLARMLKGAAARSVRSPRVTRTVAAPRSCRMVRPPRPHGHGMPPFNQAE